MLGSRPSCRAAGPKAGRFTSCSWSRSILAALRIPAHIKAHVGIGIGAEMLAAIVKHFVVHGSARAAISAGIGDEVLRERDGRDSGQRAENDGECKCGLG